MPSLLLPALLVGVPLGLALFSSPKDYETPEPDSPEEAADLVATAMIGHAYITPDLQTVVEVAATIAGWAEAGVPVRYWDQGQYKEATPLELANVSRELLSRAAAIQNADAMTFADIIERAVNAVGPSARIDGANYIFWPRGVAALVEVLSEAEPIAEALDAPSGRTWTEVGAELYQQGRAWATTVDPDGTYYTAIPLPRDGELVEVRQ